MLTVTARPAHRCRVTFHFPLAINAAKIANFDVPANEHGIVNQSSNPAGVRCSLEPQAVLLVSISGPRELVFGRWLAGFAGRLTRLQALHSP